MNQYGVGFRVTRKDGVSAIPCSDRAHKSLLAISGGSPPQTRKDYSLLLGPILKDLRRYTGIDLPLRLLFDECFKTTIIPQQSPF